MFATLEPILHEDVEDILSRTPEIDVNDSINERYYASGCSACMNTCTGSCTGSNHDA